MTAPLLNSTPPAQPVAALLAEMVLEYAQRDGSQALNDWLADTLVQRTGITPEAARDAAQSVVGYLQDSHALRSHLREHLDQGKSRSSWIANQIEHIARDHQAAPAEVAALSELLSGKAAPEGTPAAPRDWNDISRIAFAKDIEQQQLLQTAGTVLEDGARQWASSAVDVWLKDQPKSAELAQKFIRGELDVQSATGLQATLAIATDIATRQGLLGSEMRQASERGELIPAWFAQNTFVGTENARTAYAVGAGEIDASEALDRMADAGTAAMISTTRMICRQVGGEVGQKIGLVIGGYVPFLAPFAIPVGRKVGEFLGDAVGKLAGTGVAKVVQKGVGIVKNAARAVGSAVQASTAWVGEKLSALKFW